MDFLSKINANAGIDVKKSQFVAENAAVTNFEVRAESTGQILTTIDSDKAEFKQSEFKFFGDQIYATASSVRINSGAATLNIQDGELNLYNNASYIKMNTEFIEFCSFNVPMSISYDSNYGINIRNTGNLIGKLSFNTEFFKLYYGEPSSNKYAGPAFEITSKLSNSYSDVEDPYASPTAEIKSQRLNISAYSKNNEDTPGTIVLRATPNQYVDETTKKPIDNDHDATFVVDGYGIHLDSGSNPDGNSIELYTNGVDGLIDITTSNMTTMVSARKGGGKFVGGIIDTQSHTNSIDAESSINMTTGGQDVNNVFRPGASIRLSSGVDSTNTSGVASVKVETTEFLVDLGSESSVQFNFGTGLKTHINHKGINFSNSATIGIPAYTGGRLAFCSNTMFFETTGLAVALQDGGCMVFNNNGLNVSIIPDGASAPLSGNVLLSQSLRSIERMTQSEYDALAVKDENTLYIIAG